MSEKLSKYNKSGDEITRHGFVSNMEAFIRKLLSGEINSQTNAYLLSHGISSDVALKCLLDKPDKNDPTSAVLSRKESIKTDKETNKDRFHIKYTLNDRRNLEKKLRNIYIKLFEYHIVDDNKLLNEESNEPPFIADEFMIGAEGVSKTDVLSMPTYRVKTKNENTNKMKKTVILSEEQLNYIRETVSCGGCGGGTGSGNPGYAYDENGLKLSKNNPSLDPTEIMKKSFPGND